MVKIELQDNGGWHPGPEAKWTTGACEDCDTGEAVKVLQYQDDFGKDGYTWNVCEKHLENDEFVRVVKP